MFKLNTKVQGAEIVGDKVQLDLETKKGGKEALQADIVLVCAGTSLSVSANCLPSSLAPEVVLQHNLRTCNLWYDYKVMGLCHSGCMTCI